MMHSFVGRSLRTVGEAVAVATCMLLASCAKHVADTIEATGTLEVVEVNVSPSIPARVVRVLVDEGAVVHVGDTLVVLSTPTVQSDVAQREARAVSAGANLRELEHGARAGELRRAESDLTAAVADAGLAAKDAERLRGLAERQIVSAQQYDAAKARAGSSAARRDGLQAALTLLRDGTRPERVSGARADEAGARAALEGARATSRDLVLLAPVAGTITIRAAEPGEVITTGQSALVIAETRRQTVRVFVAQDALSRVQIGQPVHGVLDAYRDREFSGRVVAISSKAEFTPRVALTENERADLLFGVKVEFADSTGMLKAGLPITVHIDAPVPAEKKVPAKP